VQEHATSQTFEKIEKDFCCWVCDVFYASLDVSQHQKWQNKAITGDAE
jgi:hypothetical protein